MYQAAKCESVSPPLFFGAACSPPPPRFLFALPVAFKANGHWNCLLFVACLLPYAAGGAFYMVYLRRPAFGGLFRPFPRERESRYVAIFSSLFSLRLGFKSPFPVNISHSFRTP